MREGVGVFASKARSGPTPLRYSFGWAARGRVDTPLGRPNGELHTSPGWNPG